MLSVDLPLSYYRILILQRRVAKVHSHPLSLPTSKFQTLTPTHFLCNRHSPNRVEGGDVVGEAGFEQSTIEVVCEVLVLQ